MNPSPTVLIGLFVPLPAPESRRGGVYPRPASGFQTPPNPSTGDIVRGPNPPDELVIDLVGRTDAHPVPAHPTGLQHHQTITTLQVLGVQAVALSAPSGSAALADHRPLFARAMRPEAVL